MPRDLNGKNKKFSQHKNRQVEELSEETLMMALKKTKVEDSEEEDIDEEQEEEEEEEKVEAPSKKKEKNKELEEVKTETRTKDDDSDSSDDEKGKKKKDKNPNMIKPKGENIVLTKEQKDELAKEKQLNKELTNIRKGKGDEATLAEAARLAEIRRQREEAARDKEEQEKKLEEARNMAKQAEKSLKKK